MPGDTKEKIWTHNLLNLKHKCQPLNHYVKWQSYNGSHRSIKSNFMKQITQLQQHTINCAWDTLILHSFLSIFSKCFGVKSRKTLSRNNYQQQQFFQNSHNPGGTAAVNVHSLWHPQMKCLMVGSLENFADFCFEDRSDCSQESRDSKSMMVMMLCN